MGFAAEIKEFLGAAKDSWKLMSDTELKDSQKKYTDVKAAAEQKEMDDPLNQQLKEAKLAHMKATTGNIGKMSPLQALQYKLMLQSQQPQVNPVVGAIPDDSPAPVAAAAPPQQEDPSKIIGPQPPKKLNYNRGGLVKKFAIGGVVDEDDLAPDEDEGALPPGASPTAGTGFPAIGGYTNQPGMLTPTQQPQRRAAAGAIPTPQARPPNPVDDALKYGASQLQQLPAVGSARQRGVRGYAQGAGAAPTDDMIQIFRKIDPTGKKYSEGERNLIALQAVHSFKMNQGDPEGAARASFQMLQHFKTAQTRYGALAAAAMKGGNIDEGIKLALKQYANIPDGNDLKMWRDEETGRIGWKITTKDGDKSGGVATPEEIGSAAAKLATPGGFEQHLVQMSSGAKVGGKGVGGAGKKEEDLDETPGPMKDPAKHTALAEDTATHVENWNTAAKADPANKGKEEPTKSELAATKNALFHIRRSNDVTNDEGLRRLQQFATAPETYGKDEQPAFKTFKDPDTKMRIIQFNDGFSMKVPESDYSNIRAMRTDHLKNEAIKAKKAYDDANKPSGLADAAEGLDKFTQAQDKRAKEFDESVRSAYDTSTLKKAVGAAGNVASEASDWLSKAGKTISEKGGAGAIGAGASSLLGGGASAAPAPVNPDEDRPL